jgi:hypothetical protein
VSSPPGRWSSADLLLPAAAELVHGIAAGTRATRGDRLGLALALQRLLHKGESGGFVLAVDNAALPYFTSVIGRLPEVDHLVIQLTYIYGPAPLAEAGI